MKKFMSLLLCLAMISMMMLGCSQPAASEPAPAAEPAAAPATEAAATETAATEEDKQAPADAGDKTVIGVTYCLLSAPAVVVFQKGIQETAAAEGVTLVELDAEWDATKQSDQMDTLIAQGVDAIILNPCDGSALVPACKRASEAGIPVVCGAMDVDQSGQDYTVAFVGADDYDIGFQAGKMIAEKLSDGGDVIVIEGTAGASATTKRSEGFEAAVKDTALNIAGKFDGNFTTADAMSATEDALTKNPNLKGVFVHDDTMCIGVVQAMKSLGYTGDDIVVVSYNGSANGAQMIKDGDIVASAVQPLYNEGKVSVEACLKAIKGEPIGDRWFKDEIDMLTAENVGTYDPSLLW